MPRGALVVFEGTEGVGKTTQVARLVAQLAAAGIPCLPLREPGGTAVGEAIRHLLLEPGRTLTPAAEALLFVASRAQLVADRIRPALAEGTTVILDRFFLSTYAYQVGGRGLDESAVRAANQLAAGGVIPDVTIFLDLPVDAGMVRAETRGRRDRMEEAGGDFHARVSAAFRTFTTPEWQRAHPECGLIVRVDATGNEEEVFARVVQALVGARPDVFQPLAPGHASGGGTGAMKADAVATRGNA